MGTWGEGNFDSDGAMDYVGELTRQLAARIEEVLSDENSRSIDEEGEAVIVPSVEILSLLTERCQAPPPKPSNVADWRTRYLAVYDDEAPGFYPEPEFQAERRAIIEATFATLENQARDFWQDADEEDD